MSVCLEGVRVLELSRYQAGPRCAMLLRDLGAEVIKVEAVGGEDLRQRGPFVDGVGIPFSQHNRGKKSITLNTRSARGKDLFRELVERSDLVIENFRPGIMDKMGLGYESLNKLNPRIVLVSISGFGQYGPYRDRPAYDPVAQAMSGLAHLIGESQGKPMLSGSTIIDRSTAFLAAVGALGALFHAQRTGQGQHVDVSLLDTALTFLDIELSSCHTSGRPAGWTATIIECSDGHVVINASRAHQWLQLYHAIGRDDLANDPEFATRTTGKEQVQARQQILRDWAMSRPVTEVMRIMEEADVPCGPVQTPEQVAKDPHLWERKTMVEIEPAPGATDKMLVPGEIIKMSRVPWKAGRAPTAGEHNKEIYGGLLGLSDEELAKLGEEGIV
ncbi:MAG: CoA transferase [Chloroflexi bacterium]|nr:CoA transferase [Chloroflexota bacterium]